MQVESVEITALTADARNARKHDEVNLTAIKRSLKKFGQQKPIVIDKDNVVIAGNGTLAAAQALGWKEIKVVRSKLNLQMARAYGVADNRTAELATWDDSILGSILQELREDGWDLGDMGFDIDPPAKPDDEPTEPVEAIKEWLLVVQCADEKQQSVLYERFVAEGIACKIM